MSEKAQSIEKIYQKKSQLEHILLRPDTYIGSVEPLTQEMWIWDFENEKMIKKEITFVPGLYKIFDEILVNAADNKQRDPTMSLIRVNIDKETNTIKVYNSGKGIPVVEHKEEKVPVPTLIFGHLLTSSNYNDEEKKVTGGRNGYGAKLCNIFSKKFIVETSSKEYKKSFKQTWTGNMMKAEEPVIKESREDDYTCITFQPDLSKFKMDKLDDDIIALMARRTYDIAACSAGVKVYLNDKRLPINKFEDYCKLYLGNELDDFGNPIKVLYEKASPRWEIAIACSDIGFQQVSFVNSIATTKGGRHVDYIADQLVKYVSEQVNKKNKKSNPVKPFQIKNYMWLFVNCLIENPTFDSQTKENMTLQAKSFGSKCQLSEDFLKKVAKCGIIEKIVNWLAFKEKTDLEKAGSKSKQAKIKGVPKLDDANDAGTKESMNCTLILTEGDSAKTLAVAGLGVIGRDRYGVFPLRGKMLNVREASSKQIIENNEVSSLCKIIGLNFKEKYETRDSLKQLRYGKLMIMTDQDHDGSHIKGLIINFVHFKWPNLLKHGFVEEFITPIVKVSKGNQEKSFYSMPEFEEWQRNTQNWQSWKVKYYKGLGTSTSKEAKEYFSDMNRHRIKFEYGNSRDDLAIQLAFSKKLIEERKDWLTRFMEGRKERREQNESDDYLYQKDTTCINYRDFINKELVLFSNLDNERSIPCLVDGFKPGQRKVLFTCFKRNLTKELKVAQLAGSVAEISAYHHGEMSLMSTIINLAQNFVGSNNVNLLMPMGQFGTRLHGGKDAASPRYIFTYLNPLTRLLFNPKDDPLFNYLNDDGLYVEPEWYCPILPTVLVNGAEGIGTGWSTKIPNYNPRDIIANLKKMINNEDIVPMLPYYKNFRGTIERIDDTRVVTSGEVAVIGDNTIEITELPIGCWTQAYKENVLEPYLHGQEKVQPCITDYREYHTDATVRFVVKMNAEQFAKARDAGLHKFFKLQKTLSLNSMVLFDENGVLKRYDTVSDIIKEFYAVRLRYYVKRKQYMEGTLQAESLKLDNLARFIMEKIEGKIKVENLKKLDIVQMLRDRGYDPDPIAKWKLRVQREYGYQTAVASEQQQQQQQDEENEEDQSVDKKDYDYLLGMPIWNLTMEKKNDILKQQKEKGDELKALKEKSPQFLWLDDLDKFLIEMEKYEAKEKEEEANTIKTAAAKQLKSLQAANKREAAGKKQASKITKHEYLPDPTGERVTPQIDAQLLAKAEKEAATGEGKKGKGIKSDEINIVDLITGRTEKELDEAEIAQLVDKITKPTKERKAPVEKAEKKEKVKMKKEKSENNDEDIVLDDDDDEENKKDKSLNDDLAAIFKPKEKASSTTTAKKGETKKKEKTDKPKSSKKAGAATAAASNSGSDDKKGSNSIKNYFKTKKDDSDDSDDSSVIEDISFDEDAAASAAASRSTRNKKPISYKFDDEESKDSKESTQKKDDDDDGDDDDIYNDGSDSSFDADKDKKKSSDKKPTAAAVKKQNSEDDEGKKSVFKKKTTNNETKPNAAAAAPAEKTTKNEAKPKAAAAEKKTKSDDSKASSKVLTENKENIKKPKESKKRAKYTHDDNEEEDEDIILDESDDDYDEKPKKPATKKKLMKKQQTYAVSSEDESKTATKKRKTNLDDDELYAIDD